MNSFESQNNAGPEVINIPPRIVQKATEALLRDEGLTDDVKKVFKRLQHQHYKKHGSKQAFTDVALVHKVMEQYFDFDNTNGDYSKKSEKIKDSYFEWCEEELQKTLEEEADSID